MTLQFEKSRVKVLVTDDEPSLRTMISTYLKEEGWSVETAENGKKGLELLAQEKFHIVVSDINMPELTGIQFLEAVKKDFPQIEFVIMTSHATLETAMQAITLGAYDYLTKPFDDLGVISKKLQQVADKILLRQQNQELIKRLKKASYDLKKLFQFATALMNILDEQDLRKEVCSWLQKIFTETDVKGAWLEGKESNWRILAQTEIPLFNATELNKSPTELLSELSHLRNPKLLTLRPDEGNDRVLLYEALSPEIADLWAHELQLCFQKVMAHQEMVALAHRDGLTKLYNHRYFQDRLRQELAQAKRQQADLSVILMDVDHFKKFNDTHGHPEGDKLLKDLSSLFDREMSNREADIVARYGGEEFVIILPFTDYRGALIKAERVREVVDSYPFDHRETQPLGRVSISLGVASFPKHAVAANTLIESADKALYQAKARGRNRVVGFEDLQQKESDLPMDGKPKTTLASVLEPEVSASTASEQPKEVMPEPKSEVQIDTPKSEIVESVQDKILEAPKDSAGSHALDKSAEIPNEVMAQTIEAIGEISGESKAPSAETGPEIVKDQSVGAQAEAAPEVAVDTDAIQNIITNEVEKPKLQFKRKALGPEVDVDHLIHSLESVDSNQLAIAEEIQASLFETDQKGDAKNKKGALGGTGSEG